MADKKISELTPDVNVTGNEEIAAAEAGNNTKLNINQIKSFVLADGTSLEAAIDAALGNTDWKTTGAGVGVTDGDKGDVVVSAGGATWTIDAGVVDAGKLANDAVETAKIQDGAVSEAKIDSAVVAKFAVDASGFSGNLGPTDDTVQEIADKVDALALSGTESDYIFPATGSGSVALPVGEIGTEEQPTVHQVAATAASQTVTLPNPTATEVGQVFVVDHLPTGTDDLTITSAATLVGQTNLPAGITVEAIVTAAGEYRLVGGGSVVAGGQVDTVVAGTNVSVDATDPANPIINVTGGTTDVSAFAAETQIDATDVFAMHNGTSNVKVTYQDFLKTPYDMVDALDQGFNFTFATTDADTGAQEDGLDIVRKQANLHNGTGAVPFASPAGYQWHARVEAHAHAIGNNTDTLTNPLRWQIAPFIQFGENTVTGRDAQLTTWCPVGANSSADISSSGLFLIPKADEAGFFAGMFLKMGYLTGQRPTFDIDVDEVSMSLTYELVKI